MNENAGLGEQTMQFGLLMESAQAHQKLAEIHLEKLRAHTEDLDGVVREEIRRTLVDELRAVTCESERAAGALRDLQRSAKRRGLYWNLGIAVLCAALPAVLAHWLLPSAASVALLRIQQDELSRNAVRLAQRGGKVQWRNCGAAARLCVRVDRQAPVYGDESDYYVVKGY